MGGWQRDAAAAAALLADVTAPWVRDLGLEVKEIGRAQSHFVLPFSDQLTRDAGMICCQAIVAAADRASAEGKITRLYQINCAESLLTSRI